MNIGVDVRCFLEKNYSGVSIYTQNVLLSLARISPNDNFILHANSFSRINYWPQFKSNNINNLITHYPSKIISLSSLMFSRPYFDRWLNRPDIYWVPGNNFINLSNQVTKVYTCHDLSWHVFPEFYSRKGRIWHQALQLSKKYFAAEKIIAVSECTKNDILRFFPKIKSEKIEVIHSGISSMSLSEEQINRQTKILSLPENFILYLGNIEPRKNILSLIAAFNKINKNFPDFYLIIAGGSGWHRGYSKQVFRAIRKNSHIKYLGYVSEEQKFVLYNKAKLFVFPSYYEGFGFPPLEAMSQNCPVIASQTSSLPEVIGSAGVLINPLAVNDIAEAIVEVLKNTSLQLELKSLGQEQIKKFTWNETALKMKELFYQL